MRQPTRHPAVTDLSHDTRAPRSGRPPAQRRTGNRATRARVTVGAAAALVIIGAGFAVHTFTAGPDTPAAAPVADIDAPTQDSGLPTLNLPTTTPTQESTTTRSADAPAIGSSCAADRGDQRSGAGVIRAFQYAYYVRRSGSAARALATPTSSVLDAAGIQASIDAVPAGSTYCLSVTDIDPSVHVARMTVLQPGRPPDSFTQTITTEEVDGTWFVATFQQ